MNRPVLRRVCQDYLAFPDKPDRAHEQPKPKIVFLYKSRISTTIFLSHTALSSGMSGTHMTLKTNQSMVPSDTGTLLERALDTVLRALFFHQGAQPNRPLPSFDELVTPQRIPTRDESQIASLRGDLISAALRAQIRWLGEQAYQASGMDLMHELSDRVGALDPANDGRRWSLLNSRWDRIGDWHA